ncbi:SlyX protein [Desulfobaculum xiamenense]|uniref:SlyX protein n=1 Tax=Desulfobaculum xiamenense TaxID=995050 RepID=A0A846QJG0_9BACT|nr:SlyX family protein [Desulfobaculum xiamenense]NJB69006.1 SlyX protein [Desulfobaculum xiamenense]
MERTYEDRIIKLESDVALNLKVIDDLNDVIAAQQKQIDMLERRLDLVVSKLASIDMESGGGPADEVPPHY